MICGITLIDVGEEHWVYQLIYNNQIQEPMTYPLPFEEMSPLERSRFISEMFAPALLNEQFDVLDARPRDSAEQYLGESLDDDDEEDVSAEDIVDILNNLSSRLEDLEIRLGKLDNPNE